MLVLAINLFGLEIALSQEVFELKIVQPPRLSLTVSDTINASKGEVVDLDTLFHVEGDISYVREWNFNNGVQTQTIENPIYTIAENGVFYLTVIDENECTYLDSIALYIATGLNEFLTNKDNLHNIQVYPNPNSGTFDILISDCLPGFYVRVFNSLGIQFLDKYLDCNIGDHAEKIVLPNPESGIYFILVEKDSQIIYKQKVIILK